MMKLGSDSLKARNLRLQRLYMRRRKTAVFAESRLVSDRNRIVKIWNIDQLTHQKEQKFIETFYSVQLMRELARSKIIDTCSQNREYNPFIVFLHTMIFLHLKQYLRSLERGNVAIYHTVSDWTVSPIGWGLTVEMTFR